MAYKLALLADRLIHAVFHVSQLKRVLGPHPNATALPSQINDDLELVYAPDEILGCQSPTCGGQEVNKILVLWKHFPKSNVTWENYHTINSRFIEYNFEDKVVLQGEVNVMQLNGSIRGRRNMHMRRPQRRIITLEYWAGLCCCSWVLFNYSVFEGNSGEFMLVSGGHVHRLEHSHYISLLERKLSLHCESCLYTSESLREFIYLSK